VGDREKFGRSGMSKSAEYALCHNLVSHYMSEGTSMLTFISWKNEGGWCLYAWPWPWVAETM